MSKYGYFTYHGSLQDFLPGTERGGKIKYEFLGNPTAKDAIEAQGVPHPEIGLIYVNEEQVDFNYKIQPDDQVEIHPIQIGLIDHLQLHFIVDSHLGKLAKDLRVLGFDCLYENDYTADKIAVIAEKNNRIVLTRHIGLLKDNRVSKGYWLRSQEPEEQVKEVVDYFNLKNKLEPFTRCSICNGEINQVSKQSVEAQLPEMTKIHFQDFYQCKDCSQVYWKGSHYEKMVKFVDKLKNSSSS